jgi:hypothetical protein
MQRKYKVSVVNGYEETAFTCDGYNEAMRYAETKGSQGFHVVVEALEASYRKVAELNPPKAA